MKHENDEQRLVNLKLMKELEIEKTRTKEIQRELESVKEIFKVSIANIKQVHSMGKLHTIVSDIESSMRKGATFGSYKQYKTKVSHPFRNVPNLILSLRLGYF